MPKIRNRATKKNTQDSQDNVHCSKLQSTWQNSTQDKVKKTTTHASKNCKEMVTIPRTYRHQSEVPCRAHIGGHHKRRSRRTPPRATFGILAESQLVPGAQPQRQPRGQQSRVGKPLQRNYTNICSQEVNEQSGSLYNKTCVNSSKRQRSPHPFLSVRSPKQTLVILVEVLNI
jgi:hypothetical protein